MFKRWTPECTLAFVALIILGIASLITKDAMTTGALIAVCQQCITKMFDILKIRLGAKPEEAQDGKSNM